VKRVGLFVDGNNVFNSQKRVGWQVDAKRIVKWVTNAEGDVCPAYWYMGLPKETDNSEGFRSLLVSLGFRVVTKLVKNYGSSGQGQKANMDVELTSDALMSIEKYDTFVIFSGDNDFSYLIDILNARGKRTVVVSCAGIAGLVIRNACDTYIEYEDIKEHIYKQEGV